MRVPVVASFNQDAPRPPLHAARALEPPTDTAHLVNQEKLVVLSEPDRTNRDRVKHPYRIAQ